MAENGAQKRLLILQKLFLIYINWLDSTGRIFPLGRLADTGSSRCNVYILFNICTFIFGYRQHS